MIKKNKQKRERVIMMRGIRKAMSQTRSLKGEREMTPTPIRLVTHEPS